MISLTRAEFLLGAWEGHPVPPSPEAYASIRYDCLARKGVYCNTCAESCDPGAIGFQLIDGGVPQPQIDTERCTGCGDCLASCPAQAIFLNQRGSEGD